MKKKIIFVCLLLYLVPCHSQTMVATIKEPVETDFGTYQPFPVDIIPGAEQVNPGDNLENVVNVQNFSFPATGLDLLKQQHFFVTPVTRFNTTTGITGPNEMFDVYNEAREQGIPIFVTTDAMLHTFHLCFDYILRTCEEKRFIEQLNLVLDGLLDETILQYAATENEIVRDALTSNLNYLIVAKKLLDTTYVDVEPINGGASLEELSLIYEANTSYPSPIFGYEEDYTQYIPRGHYTRSDSLKHYFRSMMWLGRMTFACGNADDPVVRDATRRALLLVQFLGRLQVDGRPAMNVWDDIYQATVFFVGKSDDINFYQYISIAENIYGTDFSNLDPAIFANEELLTNFLQETELLPGAAITYPGQPDKGFRFMGQRFIPDSWVLDELVFNKIPDRFMPTGLDVMAVLGSDRAFEHIPEGDKNNPFYINKLDSLKIVFKSYPDETWAQNAYWNWLYSLMPMLAMKGDGYPFFMQNSAWIDKDLYAALASWAELRHDTILYAKQSGTEVSIPPSAMEVQGYVEPNPHLYGRLASLSYFMQQGLDSRGLLFDNFNIALVSLSDLLLDLKLISEKELTNRALSSEEYLTIFEIGKKLYDIVTFSRWPSEGPIGGNWDDGLEPMPVIADVHTDANSGLVLEEGVGYPYEIYVLCNIEGRPTITKGAGFSYFEFTWPKDDRLTDEKWRDILESDTPKSRPAWTNSFVCEGETHININPDFYRWQKPNSISLSVVTEPSAPAVGDDVSLNISQHGGLGSTPQVWVTTPLGNTFEVTDISSAADHSWLVSFNTYGLSSGMYYCDIQNVFYSDTLNYRTSVYPG